MSKVIVDEELKTKLNGLNDDVELCDEAGTTIGYFMSQASYERMVLDWAKAQVSDEELERLSKEKGGRTLAEIWKSLGAA